MSTASLGNDTVLPSREPCTCGPGVVVCPACLLWHRAHGRHQGPMPARPPGYVRGSRHSAMRLEHLTKRRTTLEAAHALAVRRGDRAKQRTIRKQLRDVQRRLRRLTPDGEPGVDALEGG